MIHFYPFAWIFSCGWPSMQILRVARILFGIQGVQEKLTGNNQLKLIASMVKKIIIRSVRL
jgi:hypothetical protein